MHSPLFCYALAMVFGIVLGTKLSIPLWALWAGGGLSLLLALLCFKRLRLAYAFFIRENVCGGSRNCVCGEGEETERKRSGPETGYCLRTR